MILAAGYGLRLRPLTVDRAKPAIPFLNRPLIEYSLDLMREAGIGELAVNLHHFPQTVLDAVDHYLDTPEGRDWNPRVIFSEEKEILGTAGGIGKLRDFFAGGDFAVLNGKICFEQNLKEVLEFHRQTGAVATLALIKHSGAEPFNPVLMSENGAVQGFALKKEMDDFSNAYIYTGLQILSPEFLEAVPKGRPSESVKEVYPRLIRQGRKVAGFVSDKAWFESSVPSRYLANSAAALRRRGLSVLAESPIPSGTRLDGSVVGRGVEIGERSEIRDSVIWDGARIGPGVRLRDVIICAGVQLPANVRLAGVVVTPLLDRIPGSGVPEPQIKDRYMIWLLK